MGSGHLESRLPDCIIFYCPEYPVCFSPHAILHVSSSLYRSGRDLSLGPSITQVNEKNTVFQPYSEREDRLDQGAGLIQVFCWF